MTIKHYTNVCYSRGKLHVRGFDENWNPMIENVNFNPTVWVDPQTSYHEFKESILDVDTHSWKSFVGRFPLVGLTFDSISSCKQFVSKNQRFGNVDGKMQVVKEKVYTPPSNMFICQYISKFFDTEPVSADKLKIYTYDIETEVGHRNVPDDTPIRIRKIVDNDSFYDQKSAEKETTIIEYENHPDKAKWEIWDDERKDWVGYEVHPYRFIGGFPHPMKAEERVTLITVKDINAKDIYTWGMSDYHTDRPEVHYKKCKNEDELLSSFLAFWVSNYPDIMTGWNCLPTYTNVWLNDRITKLENVKVGDALVDSVILNKSKNSEKESFELSLYGGRKIRASEDHIFPVFTKEKHEYTNFTTNNTRIEDKRVRQIRKELEDGKDIFFVIPKHENKNENLTYRKLFKSNVSLLKTFCEFDESELNDSDSLKIKLKERIILNVKLDDEISNDMMHMMGLIYTDGSFSFTDSRISFTNTDRPLIEWFRDFANSHKILSRGKNAILTLSNKNGSWLSTTVSSNNIIGILARLFLYKDSTKKNLNIENCSMLSKSQFMEFISGCIDGDGTLTSGVVSFCCYNNVDETQSDMEKIQELLLWNGYFANISNSTNLRFFCCDNIRLKNDLRLIQSKKKELVCKLTDNNYLRNSKSKIIAFRNLDDSYVVRLEHIESIGVEKMYDIETDTHYFYANGIKTHNCGTFDNTYMYNRIKKRLGEEQANRLSPFGEIIQRPIKGTDDVETSYAGIANLDYLKLYRKFNTKAQENYKLDTIANLEIGFKKVENPTGGSFRDFYTGQFEVRQKPKDDDTEIRKLAYIRTKLYDHYKETGEGYEKWEALDKKIRALCAQTFIDYNIRDVELVDKIDNKRKYISLAMTIAYSAQCNYEDVFSPVKTWDYILYNHLYHKGLVIPIKKHTEKTEKFEGAYVKPPLVGKHEYCESFDLDSLLN